MNQRTTVVPPNGTTAGERGMRYYHVYHPDTDHTRTFCGYIDSPELLVVTITEFEEDFPLQHYLRRAMCLRCLRLARRHLGENC